MWGDGLRQWFELFAGIAVYLMTEHGPDDNSGWINVTEFEKRFASERLRFAGKQYDAADEAQRNALLEAILRNASTLCSIKLLERRRRISPPSLDYRVSKLGRKVDGWGYGERPGVRKRAVFFAIEAFFRLKKHRKFVVFGAAGWAVLNAFKFYSAALEWLRSDLFAVISALVVAVLLWVGFLFR